METKTYNSKLRALLSIRNFKKALADHYDQMMHIEKNFNELHENAAAIIEAHCSPESQEKWKKNLKKVSDELSSINNVLSTAKEKVNKKDRSNSTRLWKLFDSCLYELKEANKASEQFGFEILPDAEHKHWQKDICNFEDTILPLIIAHAEACRMELHMIEKYTPKELDKMTKVILDHIPEDFTFEEADQYEKDYLRSVEDLKKETHQKKNIWDRFLDLLAGGTHQSPSERVMMQRWLEGEKQDL